MRQCFLGLNITLALPQLAAKRTVQSLGRAGLPTTTRFHDLRHTAATLMIGAGVPLKTVSDILGHSSIKLTADTYGYTFEQQMESALENLAQLLRGEHDGSVG